MNLSVEGNIEASESGASKGVDAWAYEITVTAEGAISAASEGVTGLTLGVSVIASGQDAFVDMTAKEITATGEYAFGAGIQAEDGAMACLAVSGDISGDMGGLGLDGGKGGGSIDVLIEGTLSGDDAVVVFSEGLEDSVTLTVWKAEVNEEGTVVGTPDYDCMMDVEAEKELLLEAAAEKDAEEAVQEDAEAHQAALAQTAEALEKSILYIIKLVQPEAGGTISVTDENGGALTKSHDYDTAKEGDTVVLKTSLDAKYSLKAAFNGLNEKTELLKNAAGNFFLVVPKGGGVILSVELEKEEDPEPDPDPNPAVQTPTVVLKVKDEEERITLTFFDDRTFTAKKADGGQESGTYKLADGKIVLVSAAGDEMPVEKAEDEEEAKLVYRFGAEGNETFEIPFTDEELDILRAVFG